jgi:hypothetical protein
VAHPAPAASGRAPCTPDSNTAPSSRAYIASSGCLTSFLCRRPEGVEAGRRNAPYSYCSPVMLAGLCADSSSVSSGMYTITSGSVADRAGVAQVGDFC